MSDTPAEQLIRRVYTEERDRMDRFDPQIVVSGSPVERAAKRCGVSVERVQHLTPLWTARPVLNR